MMQKLGLPSYQYTEIQGEGDEHSGYYTRKINLKTLLVAGCVLFGVFGFARHVFPSQVDEEVPAFNMLEGSSNADRACTFRECEKAQCDHDVAPFVCLIHNGGPHMGCSGTEWTPESCDDQCDLSNCDSIPIPDDVESCESIECGDEWCMGGQTCPGDAAPFQCMNGSARFGCSADKYHWVVSTSENECSECCDTTSCSYNN
mmetsp:Transcript_5230/g.9179  ORF Transcript_5230/g.9179 Transcript_5230/m.9179 type:complete len:202 (-) Transcript_5230:167-772(-)|eukprot:CAMPEP_0198280076 /NCGR_PEP_ID=MMETSP1449-20131203/237_1 /TAXON_ID=420275 /ORGANISM="Attheya septentrionalis, Strain CCMP2084" /LENGTH=201 /DNA_ID=CAMNT_0043975343 /DNA_START=36 /DNA_END=641 /DNA_ORIENTATION=-